MKTSLKIFFTLLVLQFAVCISAFAQNLVPNPSFEDYSSCPDSYDEVYKASGWNIDFNSCDYFHSCFNGPPPPAAQLTVPNNFAGYQCAATGNAYCAFHPYRETQPEYREYLGRELSNPLIPEQLYYVSIKVSMAEWSKCAINKIGVLFTNVFYGDTSVLPAPVTNNFSHVYISNIINDTAIWTNISGSFTSDSAYKYILIGNFFNDANTDTLILSGDKCVSYYYVDDICVSTDSITCVDITRDIVDFSADSTTIQEGDCINFSMNTVVNYDSYLWQFTGAIPNNSNVSNSTNICYDSSGTYSVTLIASNSSGCGDTIIKTDYITVEQVNDINTLQNQKDQIKFFSFNDNKIILIKSINNKKIKEVKIFNTK